MLPAIRASLRRARLFARTDPVHDGTAAQVDELVSAGVQMLMLPYFRTPEEVAEFLGVVDGRAGVVLLLETADAARRIDEILALGGIEEVHVGVNDFAIDLGLANRFAVLDHPLVLTAVEQVHSAGIRLAVGGVGRVDDGSLPIPPDLMYAQLVRLGAGSTILARSFAARDRPLAPDVARSREAFARWRAAPAAELAAAHERFKALTTLVAW